MSNGSKKEGDARLDTLVGSELANWRIEQFIGVYTTDEEGRTRSQQPKGLYKSWVVAKAIKKQETHIDLSPVNALTDGKRAFLFLAGEAIPVCDDEAERLKQREKVLAKLAPEERAVLGFELPEEEQESPAQT